MTKQEFLKEHRPEWLKLTRKPMFTDLLTMIGEESPAKIIPVNEGDKLHGAPVFLNEIYGWERLLRLLKSLATEPDRNVEVADKFTESEV